VRYSTLAARGPERIGGFPVNTTRVLVVLTLVNLGLLGYQVVRSLRDDAGAGGPILRGGGLEIVDGEGRVRAQIKIEPADDSFEMPDGSKGYPETVIFRLITPDGKPRVKVDTSLRGSGLLLLGDSDETQAILAADDARTRLKLRDDGSAERVLHPRAAAADGDR
jgi:hypothetical protein